MLYFKIIKNRKFANYLKNICIFAAYYGSNFWTRIPTELYVNGRTTSKKHRFQPDVIVRYVKVINMMKNMNNVLDLARYNGLHYEHLSGDKNGYSSVRVNNKYRIEFTEETIGDQQIATICNITELSNHYQ